MKTDTELHAEIDALRALAAANPNDALAQASIEGQINALEWVLNYQTG